LEMGEGDIYIADVDPIVKAVPQHHARRLASS
jgi:hypothetical protein